VKTYAIYIIDDKGFGNCLVTQVPEEKVAERLLTAFRYTDRVEVVRERKLLPLNAFDADYEQAVADLKPEFHEDYKCDDEEA